MNKLWHHESSRVLRSIRRMRRALIGPNPLQEALSFSQAGQDFWVYGEVFNEMKTGYFVDLGAFDGVYLSNTYLLEKRYHWNGVCIEANPRTFISLRESRGVNCVNAFVADGQQIFSLMGHGTVTHGVPLAKCSEMTTEGNTSPDSKDVKSFSLVEILLSVGAPNVIEYLSADIEGSEDLALLNHDFDRFRFQSMTIERPSQQLRQRLAGEGYILVKEIPDLDCFYISKDIAHDYCARIQRFYSSGNRFLSIFD